MLASTKALPAESLGSHVKGVHVLKCALAKTRLFNFRVVGLELGERSEGHRSNWRIVVLQPCGVALTYPFRGESLLTIPSRK